MISHHPLSIVSDSYRTIRTALLFSQPEKPPKVVLLTSPHPHDGKTVSTLNLAISLAQGGYKVLVIDGDLRKGNCHALLNRQNNRGLSNILTGSLALENGVQGTAVAGLAFLSRGVIPPNPPDLLGSHKMKEVLEMLRQDFDFVLLDSPPAIAVSDAAVLSTLCDGVVLVLRGQKTTLQAARLVVERLKAARARILGVVLNGIDIRNPDYADYRSYYRSYYAAVVKEKVGK
jgi:capsular exopolysaccharide synthesis family protein